MNIIHIFTARLEKRAMVIFSQASVCPTLGGEVGDHGPGHNTYPPPPHGSGQNIYPPPPPGPGHNTSPPGSGQNIYPPPPRTRSEHLPPPPGPGNNTPPPPGSGQNIYPPPPPRDQVRTSTPPRTRSEHLPPPQDQVRTSTPPPRLHAGGGGTHPTGMHSCLNMFFLVNYLSKKELYFRFY